MRKVLFTLLPVLVLPLLISAQPIGGLQSPEAFLPTNYGDNFTPHHEQLAYFNYIANNSDRVQLVEYGRTNEDRPLILAYVSTPENLNRLEDIRKANLQRAGMLPGTPDAANAIPIVWLSFGVHGNEAGASESALTVLYKLAVGDSDIDSWLAGTLVIMDPCLNPDGNSRYTSWYRSIAGRYPDPDRASREHDEPWPGGRINHYYFDLNRDWAWATQKETRARLEQYHRWMPQVHVDAHEQYPNDPFYFAPAAHPYHPAITEWQAEFQMRVGQNNARYFDSSGWLYFTREIFDLFYPSYGDTYPVFNGSIGMTYEQAGHGISGRAIEMDNGDTLTIQDRIDHHSTAALATVETAYRNREELLENFQTYFREASNTNGREYNAFVISKANATGRIRQLTDLLDLHEIQYSWLTAGSSVNGYDYQSGERQEVTLEAGDLLIAANQPQGNLVRVLFEPEPFLEDSLTYDITAWSLPLAYGLQAYGLQRIPAGSSAQAPVVRGMPFPMANPDNPMYAYAVRWEGLEDAHFLGSLLQADIKVRFAGSEFQTGSQTFAPGTLLITRADNRKNPDWEARLLDLAQSADQEIFTVPTGFSVSGPDLGSASMRFIQAPRIMLVWGERFDPNAVGAAWHYFEQVLEYPVTLTEDTRINAGRLADYDLLVVPTGRLNFKEDQWSDLTDWIRGGGRLIATGGALSNFSDRDGYGLSAKPSPPDENLESDPMSYGGRERSMIPESVPGAIFRAKTDTTHPLSFGIGGWYHSLKTSGQAYDYLSRGATAAYLESNYQSFGFAGWKAKKRLQNTLIAGHQPMGRGSVIYLTDDPLFRGFWYQGLFLMSNAVFFAGN